MTAALPKPAKRGPRPRKAIRRTVAPRKRSKGRSAVDAADAEWRAKVRAKYGDRCFHWFCGNPATDTHHIIGKKAHPRLRYDVENGAPMCREHHNEAHARPVWFKENFRGWYHARWCSLLDKAAREARLA